MIPLWEELLPNGRKEASLIKRAAGQMFHPESSRQRLGGKLPEEIIHVSKGIPSREENPQQESSNQDPDHNTP